MHLFPISCLLCICILTSLTNGKIDSNTKFKKSKVILLSFKPPQNTLDALQDEEIIDEVKELEPNIVYYLHVQSIPAGVKFIVLQTHAYLHNVTLGYNIEKVPNKYVTGQNIGLVQNVSSSGTAEFYLENDNSFNTTVLLAVVAYNKNAPVPGGCNLEFGVETAPWMQVNATGSMVIVNTQPGRGPSKGGSGGTCDLPSLRYQAYHLYLPEKDFFMSTYFDYIRKMLTAKRIVQNGREVRNNPLLEMRHVFSEYHGTGSVYAVIVTSEPSFSAAYVPALTYSCSPAHYTDTCQVLTSTFSRSLCALVLFIGLFVCLLGHFFFQTEVFLMGTLIGAIITYVVVAPYGFTDSTNVAVATVGGVTAGNLLLTLWWVSGSPLLSIIQAYLTVSFLFSAIIFHAGLADTPIMVSDLNYWLAFVCLMLIPTTVFGACVNRLNIIACSVVGSYAAIVPVDHYIGANLKYIFINVIRRATVPGFYEAILNPPFQTRDFILVYIWIALAAIGFVLQSQRLSNRPPFPPHSNRSRSAPPSGAQTPLLNDRQFLYGQPVGSPGSDSVFS